MLMKRPKLASSHTGVRRLLVDVVLIDRRDGNAKRLCPAGLIAVVIDLFSGSAVIKDLQIAGRNRRRIGIPFKAHLFFMRRTPCRLARPACEGKCTSVVDWFHVCSDGMKTTGYFVVFARAARLPEGRPSPHAGEEWSLQKLLRRKKWQHIFGQLGQRFMGWPAQRFQVKRNMADTLLLLGME